MKRFVLHVLYVLHVAQVGGDINIQATPVLKECDEQTLSWTVEPPTPFHTVPGGVVLEEPEAGEYVVSAINGAFCQAFLELEIATSSGDGR